MPPTLQIQQSHFSILIKIISTIGSVVISGGYFYQTKKKNQRDIVLMVGSRAPSSQRQARHVKRNTLNRATANPGTPSPPPSSLKLTPMLALAAGLVADMRSLGQVIRGFGYVEPRNGRREQFYIPLNPPPPPPLFHNHEYRVSVRGKPFTNSCQHFNMLNSLQHRMASNDKISFLGKFALAGSCDPISRLPVYVHVSQNEWNSLENSDVSNVSYSG